MKTKVRKHPLKSNLFELKTDTFLKLKSSNCYIELKVRFNSDVELNMLKDQDLSGFKFKENFAKNNYFFIYCGYHSLSEILRIRCEMIVEIKQVITALKSEARFRAEIFDFVNLEEVYF